MAYGAGGGLGGGDDRVRVGRRGEDREDGGASQAEDDVDAGHGAGGAEPAGAVAGAGRRVLAQGQSVAGRGEPGHGRGCWTL